MTSRSKNAVRGYETEIEKSREEGNWKKAIELAQQLKARSPQHESLAHFLIGEGKLEAHLDERPPTKENIERAQRELSDARGYLTLATDDAGKKAGVALDAHLLLGKLNYACGSYDEALKHYKLAELDTLTEKELPVRSLRIVAESYAIKGLCLEQNAVPSSTSRYKQAERETEMIRSFELASDLTLLYLQRTNSASVRAGPTLETALQRVPILHMRAGRLHCAIDRYREMLTAVESVSTQALRLTLTRQLAEVLLRGVTGQVYKPPEKIATVPAQGTLTRRREEHVSEGPWKPKKYAAINQVAPAHTRWPSTPRRCVPRTLRCGSWRPTTAIERDGSGGCAQIEDGIELAEEALAIEEELGGAMLPRCCLYTGIGYQMKAQKSNSRIDKDAANDSALKYFLRAVQLDDNDHLAFYHLGLQYMYLGMLNEAMEATRASLMARAECGGSLRLVAALWSCACAGRRAPRALAAAHVARAHYPRADWPRALLAALQLAWDSPEAALITGKELLSLLNSTEAEAEAEQNGYMELDALSDSQHDDTHSTRDAASVRAEFTGAHQLERALSECASSQSAVRTRAPLATPRAHAWLLLAEICLRLGRVSAAAGCVSEATALTPFSHLVLYTRGMVHAASNEWEEARQCFQNALAIHPTHLDSMVQLGAEQL
ncbi:hypothetical protein O3G_MSEX001450 [Manduca sexta]|uniref:Tetratricopeptide repeat protein 7 N-terminal domain-containing protein n=1 Tax=Manduca sexta TaxID=7130 RepID=A0A921YKK9_MANSE|nr:hypothetical protein O3G_MSEX001450 [Manduca sexta]